MPPFGAEARAHRRCQPAQKVRQTHCTRQTRNKIENVLTEKYTRAAFARWHLGDELTEEFLCSCCLYVEEWTVALIVRAVCGNPYCYIMLVFWTMHGHREVVEPIILMVAPRVIVRIYGMYICQSLSIEFRRFLVVTH